MKSSHARQQGISLFVVLVIVMLSMLLAVGASRTALFNELLTGNDSDYQRAFEAAQALVRDAELDIMGMKANGTPCQTSAAYVGCRSSAGGSGIFLPQSENDYLELTQALQSQALHCQQGLCVDANLGTDFWSQRSTFDALRANGVAARYGEFTGALKGADSNPRLDTAWYWIEILRYQVGAGALGGGGAAATLAPSSMAPFVYRITAVAQGARTGTLAVVQTIFSLTPAD